MSLPSLLGLADAANDCHLQRYQDIYLADLLNCSEYLLDSAFPRNILNYSAVTMGFWKKIGDSFGKNGTVTRFCEKLPGLFFLLETATFTTEALEYGFALECGQYRGVNDTLCDLPTRPQSISATPEPILAA